MQFNFRTNWFSGKCICRPILCNSFKNSYFHGLVDISHKAPIFLESPPFYGYFLKDVYFLVQARYFIKTAIFMGWLMWSLISCNLSKQVPKYGYFLKGGKNHYFWENMNLIGHFVWDFDQFT